MRRSLWVLLLILPGLFPARALGVEIDNGLAPPNPANVVTSVVDEVLVYDQGCAAQPIPCPAPGPPTAVEIGSGGAAIFSLTVYGSSRLTVTPVALGAAEDAVAFDQATLEIFQGAPNSVAARGASTVRIDPGAGLIQFVDAYDASTLEVSSGSTEFLRARNDAVVRIEGGSHENASARNNATLHFSGGQISLVPLAALDSARVVLDGGQTPVLEAYDSARIEIVGFGFALGGAPVGYGTLAATGGVLTGFFPDGTPIDQISGSGLVFSRDATASVVLVAPPAAAVPGLSARSLLGLGALVVTTGLLAGRVRATSRARSFDTRVNR